MHTLCSLACIVNQRAIRKTAIGGVARKDDASTCKNQPVSRSACILLVIDASEVKSSELMGL
jgi:hypothetical protein